MPVMRQLDIVQPVERAEEPHPRGTMLVRRLGCASLAAASDGVIAMASSAATGTYRAFFADSPG